MDYHLAIPSHRRAKMLGEKTLKFLRLSNGPAPTIYVGDQQDFQEYKELYPNLEIVIAPKGIAAARNYVQDIQPLGKRIVYIDDDIIDVYHLDFSSDKPKKYKVRDFNALIQEGFDCMERAQTTFWGVMPTDHTLCMKPLIRRNLTYVNGSLYGLINSRVSVIQNHLEDFERCLRYWKKEGRLCRLEFIGLLTKYYKNAGGLQETRNELMTSESALKLVDEFPELCSIRKKRGRWDDLKFKRFPPNFLDGRVENN
jgi:hypothetical protein